MERHGRDALVVGLRGMATPTLEDVEQRRLQLWIAMVVLVVAVTAAMAGVAARGDLPVMGDDALPTWFVCAALLALVVAFCAYAIEKELHLRRLTRHLLSERVLVTALENRLEALSTLLDAGQAMNSVLELPEVLRRILDNALELLGASNGSVLLAEEPGVLRAVCVHGNDAARNSVVLVGDDGVAGRVAATLEPVLVSGELTPGDRDVVPHSAMSVPLVHRGELVGVLNVNAASGRTFDEYDLRALGLFGEHAASAIANARLYETERENAQALAHRAQHDPLTDLGNRNLFAQRVGAALSRESARSVAVLFVDLDDFKKVNDSLGHATGDELLCRVADRLRSALRGDDLAARLGGDEFGVLLEDVPSAVEASRAAERLLLALSGPIELVDRTLSVRASIGVAVARPGEATAEELLRNADLAMYIAKAQGRGCVRLFESGMHAALVERLELEGQLEVAVERAELDLRYQPVVSLATGRVCGFEALVRWNHPARGELLPAAFIPLAEETGLVIGIDRWVLLQACCQAAAWDATYPSDDPLVVSVNLSTRQLEDERVVDNVALALEVSGLPPHHLVVEITESFLVRNPEQAVPRLEALRRLGVRLAMDDFGTGYSSLAQLRHLPIDVLKIDRCFIDGLDRREDDAALVQAMLRLAASLGLETVAEGVERAGQRAMLAELGCHLAQGWYFAQPLTTAEMEDLLRRRLPALPAPVS